MKIVILTVLIAIAISLVLPVWGRLPRGYFQGKDQYQWSVLLKSNDVNDRQRAVYALCDIARKGNYRVKNEVSHIIVENNAIDAIPILTDMINSNDPDLSAWANKVITELTDR